ncbi:hypothetical protein LVY74_01685 [Acinetobacter sp. ME22]|uniref:hypothetical protein n=1 Tax=Acinetobacter sp. ME22 TaxID=2904802 RepID=UPI001EDB7C36|nr:hypothetical protein [Acinetobacter sp. ME22]MCG2572268.1 hypothetical protein [Acinetobacter sp. ME22]
MKLQQLEHPIEHPCLGKCTEFKTESCGTCLVQQIETCGLTSMPLIHENFVVDDVVVIVDPRFADDLFVVTAVVSKPHFLYPCACVEDSSGNKDLFGFTILRRATTAELKAKKRLLPDVEKHHQRALEAQGEVS